MLKRLFFISLVLLMASVMIVGCADDAPAPAPEEGADPEPAPEVSDGDLPVLGVSMIDLNHPFYVQMMNAGDVAADDWGVEVVWQSAEGSLERQLSVVENFIEQGVDCILIDPIDKEGVIPAVNAAAEAGIPVITMGNFVDTPHNVNTLYNDYQDFGTLTDIMAASIGFEGTVVLLVGGVGNFVSDERQRGFEETIANYPDIEVLSIQPSDWDPAKGMEVMENWLTSYENIDAFMCVSDGVTFAALEAIRNAGREDEIKVFSYDGEPAASEMVAAGDMVANLLTGATRVGYWNIKTGAHMAKGETFDQRIYLPTHFIMTQEVYDDLIEKGFEPPEGFSWVEPEEAIVLFDGYSEELGPQ